MKSTSKVPRPIFAILLGLIAAVRNHQAFAHGDTWQTRSPIPTARRISGALLSCLLLMLLVCGFLLGVTVIPVARAQEQGASGPPVGSGNPLADLQRQIDELKQRLSETEVTSQPLSFTVNCAAGEKVADALAQGVRTTNRVTITIVGVCREAVAVRRDDVWLQGASPGDGLEAPSATGTVLSLTGRRLRLVQLTLSGGSVGLGASGGANFFAINLHVTGASGHNVGLSGNAVGSLTDSTLEESPQLGVWVSTGASLTLNRAIVQNNGFRGIQAGSGGLVSVNNGSVVRNNGDGATALLGGVITLGDSTVDGNAGWGVHAAEGDVEVGRSSVVSNNGRAGLLVSGKATVYGGARVVGNSDGGILVGNGGAVGLRDGVIVESNQGHGLELRAASSAEFGDRVIVRDNTRDGIHVVAASAVSFEAGENGNFTQHITGNRGFGITCVPAPVVAQLGWWQGTVVSGNGSDEVNCLRF